jgi:hypothetical protein
MWSTLKTKNSTLNTICCFALGIVADSPQAGEPASLPRTMSGKPDGELASRNAQMGKIVIFHGKIQNSIIIDKIQLLRLNY